MKTFIIALLLSSIVYAQAPAYTGPSSAAIQLQIAVVQAQQKSAADQQAVVQAQAAVQAQRLASQLAQLQAQLAAAQAAGQ